MARFALDDELAAFLVSCNAVVVATRSAALEPHATRACGLSVSGRDRVCLLLPVATSAQSMANLRENGEIAVVVSAPADYRTMQIKGRFLDAGEASEDDILSSQRHLQVFAAVVSVFGITRQQVRNLWMFDSWRVEIEVTSAYLQTPGPGAGAPLPRARA